MRLAKAAPTTARHTQLRRKKSPSPRKVANSAQRSTTESTNAPRGLAACRRRATAPSRMSSVPARIVSQPARKMQPVAKAVPASTLTASCAQVSASGGAPRSTSIVSNGASTPRYQARRRGPSNVPSALGSLSGGVRASPRNASATAAAITSAAAAAVPGRQGLTLDLPAQKALQRLAAGLVAHLTRRMLHEVGADAGERPADAAVERDAAAADGVDHDAARVRAVFHRKANLELHRRVGEPPSFEAHETHLVVAEPRHVVARPDVDVRPRQRLGEHALHGLGLRLPLGLRACVVEHVEEVGVAAHVELVAPIKHEPPVGEQPGERPV